MAVYAIAQLRFTDRAADERPQIVVGRGDREKVVLMSDVVPRRGRVPVMVGID